METSGDKNLEDLHLLKGKSLLDQKKCEDAKKEFDEVLNINPNNADAYFYKGMANINNDPKEPQEAIDNFSKCISIDPNEKIYYYNYGMALIDGNYLSEAIPYLYKGYEIDNTFYKPLIKISEIFIKQGQYPEANQYLDLVLNAEPNNEEALNKKSYSQ